MLSHAVSLPEDERAKPAPVKAPPPELMASLQQAAAALRLDQAEQMRAAVFRPSHALPTVTLAEQVHDLVWLPWRSMTLPVGLGSVPSPWALFEMGVQDHTFCETGAWHARLFWALVFSSC